MGLTNLNFQMFFFPRPHYLFVIFCLSLTVRLIFALKFPEFGGDADIYLRVAGNIINGCGVAISAVDSATCVPHFGGNQGPGYPLFIAVNWMLFDNSNTVVRFTQSIIVCMSVVYFVSAIEKFLQSEKNGKVFKISQERCARVDYQSAASLGETLSPKLGDLVVSVTERFGNIEKKMGVLVEITDEPGKYVLAKILKGETSSIVAFDSLIVME